MEVQGVTALSESAMCALGLGRCSCKVPLQSAAQSAAVRRLLRTLCSLGTDAIAAKCCCKMSCAWVLLPLQGAAAGCCCQSAAVRVLLSECCVCFGA